MAGKSQHCTKKTEYDIGNINRDEAIRFIHQTTHIE